MYAVKAFTGLGVMTLSDSHRMHRDGMRAMHALKLDGKLRVIHGIQDNQIFVGIDDFDTFDKYKRVMRLLGRG